EKEGVRKEEAGIWERDSVCSKCFRAERIRKNPKAKVYFDKIDEVDAQVDALQQDEDHAFQYEEMKALEEFEASGLNQQQVAVEAAKIIDALSATIRTAYRQFRKRTHPLRLDLYAVHDLFEKRIKKLLERLDPTFGSEEERELRQESPDYEWDREYEELQ